MHCATRAQIVSMHEDGYSIRTIADMLGVTPAEVREVILAELGKGGR